MLELSVAADLVRGVGWVLWQPIMQGIAGLQDFLLDIDLATTANAGDQIAGMESWWFEITPPIGQSAHQIAAGVSNVVAVNEAVVWLA